MTERRAGKARPRLRLQLVWALWQQGLASPDAASEPEGSGPDDAPGTADGLGLDNAAPLTAWRYTAAVQACASGQSKAPVKRSLRTALL